VPRRLLGWTLLVLLTTALAAHVETARRRLRASKILNLVERVSPRAAAAGAGGRPLLRRNLELAAEAEALDPAEPRLPLARGSVLLLLGEPRRAIAAYRAALAIEPRAEIYLNLGRAQGMVGATEEARRNLALAVRLDPRLARAVPAEARRG
jgi:tetratricopeptide (TPR) repeat protein